LEQVKQTAWTFPLQFGESHLVVLDFIVSSYIMYI